MGMAGMAVLTVQTAENHLPRHKADEHQRGDDGDNAVALFFCSLHPVAY